MDSACMLRSGRERRLMKWPERVLRKNVQRWRGRRTATAYLRRTVLEECEIVRGGGLKADNTISDRRDAW